MSDIVENVMNAMRESHPTLKNWADIPLKNVAQAAIKAIVNEKQGHAENAAFEAFEKAISDDSSTYTALRKALKAYDDALNADPPAPNNQREISDIARLIVKIDHGLDYFQTEFPALSNERNRQVWADPISYHCGGISPNDLMSIRSILASIREPVSVEDCINKAQKAYNAEFAKTFFKPTIYYQAMKSAVIAALEAAGVKYAD